MMRGVFSSGLIGDSARDGALESAGDDGAEGSAWRKSTYEVETSAAS